MRVTVLKKGTNQVKVQKALIFRKDLLLHHIP